MRSGTLPRMLLVCALILAGVAASETNTASLHGVVTDPSGALVPGAVVQVHGPAGDQRKNAEFAGACSISDWRTVNIRSVIAKGFTLLQQPGVEVNGPTALDLQLMIEAESQVVNVEEEANKVMVDPQSNADALVLGQRIGRPFR